MNLPAGRQESLDMRIHFYSSAFVHSLQYFDSVALGWAWRAFLSSYIFLGRQCRGGQQEKKCGHQIPWTCRVDSLFSSCPGTPKDIRSLFGKKKSEMKYWDRLKTWAWAGAERVGENTFQLLNIGTQGLKCIFAFSIKAWCLERQNVFKGHQISIDEEQNKNRTTSLSQFSSTP